MPGSGIRSLGVLLVDDDADTLEMYTLGLQYQGFTVRISQHPERVLDQILQDPPDCIVADIRMAGLTGPELRQRIAADPRVAGVPCLALSGSAFDRDIQIARAAGFDEVLIKPCLPEELAVAIVRAVVRRRVQAHQVERAAQNVLQNLSRTASFRR